MKSRARIYLLLVLVFCVSGCSDNIIDTPEELQKEIQKYHQMAIDNIALKIKNSRYKVIHHSSYPKDSATVEPGEMFIFEDMKNKKMYSYNTFIHKKSEFKELIEGQDYP